MSESSASPPKPALANAVALFPWLSAILISIALIAAVVVSFLPPFTAEFVKWDDPNTFSANPNCRGLTLEHVFWAFTHPYAGHYHPLTFISFMVDFSLWKLNAPFYHAHNILLHAISAVLWWRLLTRLKIPAAWLAAAIFALHPVNVESVAWITERKNTLAMFFYVVSLLWYLKYEAANQRKWYGLALAAFWFARKKISDVRAQATIADGRASP